MKSTSQSNSCTPILDKYKRKKILSFDYPNIRYFISPSERTIWINLIACPNGKIAARILQKGEEKWFLN